MQTATLFDVQGSQVGRQTDDTGTGQGQGKTVGKTTYTQQTKLELWRGGGGGGWGREKDSTGHHTDSTREEAVSQT